MGYWFHNFLLKHLKAKDKKKIRWWILDTKTTQLLTLCRCTDCYGELVYDEFDSNWMKNNTQWKKNCLVKLLKKWVKSDSCRHSRYLANRQSVVTFEIAAHISFPSTCCEFWRKTSLDIDGWWRLSQKDLPLSLQQRRIIKVLTRKGRIQMYWLVFVGIKKRGNLMHHFSFI